MLHFTEFEFEDNGPKRAVLIDVPESYFPNEVASELHAQHRSKLLPVDLIILRPSVWVSWNPTEQEDYVDGISERFPDVSVKLLMSKDYKHLIVNSQNDPQQFQFENNQQPFLEKLRTEELKQLVKRSEALYLSDSSSIFWLPSQILSNIFLRAGNIQTSRGALDKIFFWLLPHLREVKGILIDTWSISSIALNASRLLSVYEPCKANVKVEMLDNYIDGRMETREELEEIIRRISDGFQQPFLIIFSVAMTGKSLNNFSSALTTMGCPEMLQNYLVLFRLRKASIRVNGTIIPELCDLSNEPAIVEEPDQNIKTQIKIDPTTYFPIFSNEKVVRLTKEIASKHKTFFSRYSNLGAIRIHKNSLVGGQKFRHHGIYLDVLKMLDNRHFSSKFRKIIDDLNPPPKIILVPPHDAGKALAEIAAERLSNRIQRPKIIEHLGSIAPNDDAKAVNDMQDFHNEIKQFDKHEALLVLDDVMTTGARYLGYQKCLRQLEYKGQIYYRAGVSRTSSVGERNEIVRTLKPNNSGPDHTIEFVEEVILPNWDEASCPLCIENKLLDQLIIQKTVLPDSKLVDRANQLRIAVENGLVENVFLRLSSTQPLQITRGSLFVKKGAPEATVLCSVAAAIQEFRTNLDASKRLDARGFPVRKVFSIKDLQRYTDGILQASLLRCVTAEEFHRISPENDIEFVDWVCKIFKKGDRDSCSTHPELALAIGLRKIPSQVANTDFENKIANLGLSDLLPVIKAGRN